MKRERERERGGGGGGVKRLGPLCLANSSMDKKPSTQSHISVYVKKLSKIKLNEKKNQINICKQ